MFLGIPGLWACGLEATGDAKKPLPLAFQRQQPEFEAKFFNFGPDFLFHPSAPLL
jgi:hypothetical protein